MDIIDRFRNNIPKTLPIKYIGIFLISLSLLLAIISIPIALTLREQKLNYLSSQDINMETISIKMQDGVLIQGLVYIDNDLKDNDTNSIPTILFLHGINGRKEHKVNIIFQYVKHGYAVFSLDQRGHGESGSPSGFLNKEPQDMIEVIDFIDANYHYANTTHIGIIGFSYGGGIGAILQALEDRIYASVLYHPLASLDGLSNRIPLQNLIGTTIAVSSISDIQDAFDLANATNTKNLLLLQGLSDKIILPSETNDFYNLVNGTNRTDIDLKERPGLGHEGNELDPTSLKYAITWFKHFYYNHSIDLTNLDSEINSVSLFTFNYPSSSTAENLTIAFAIILFIGLSSLVLKFKIKPYWDNLPIKKDIDLSREGKEKYKKMIIYRTSGYFGALIVTGFIFFTLNRSLLYGYFIFFPILSSVIMLFFPSELHSNWKEEWKNWIKNDSLLFLYTLSIIIIPAIFFLLLYNLNNKLTISFTIPFFNLSTLPYIVLGLGSGIMDFLYLREMKGRHAMILLIIRPLSVIIFLTFVPLSPFPILGGAISQILFIFLIGVILFYIRSLVNYLSKIYKNSASLYLLIMLPFVIFYLRVFFRII